MICNRITAVVFQPCLVDIVTTPVTFASNVTMVTGGLQQKTVRLTHISVTSSIPVNTFTGSIAIRSMVFQYGYYGIDSIIFGDYYRNVLTAFPQKRCQTCLNTFSFNPDPLNIRHMVNLDTRVYSHKFSGIGSPFGNVS